MKKYQQKSIKTKKLGIHYHKTECPKCGRQVKLLWVPNDPTTSLPLCEKCFKVLDPEIASTYKVFFLPLIIVLQNGNWLMKDGLSHTFMAIREYLGYCFYPENCPKELKKFLTRDVEALSILLNDLKKCYRPSKYKNDRDKDNNDIERLTKLYEEYKKNKIKRTNQKISWKILPPGKYPFEKIKSHFEQLELKGTTKTYDLNRLQILYELGPTETYIGLDEFKGYVVFYFQEKELAILECPVTGNAIYLISGNWQDLSKLSKSELLTLHRTNTKRIIHKGQWHEKLLSILRLNHIIYIR